MNRWRGARLQATFQANAARLHLRDAKILDQRLDSSVGVLAAITIADAQEPRDAEGEQKLAAGLTE